MPYFRYTAQINATSSIEIFVEANSKDDAADRVLDIVDQEGIDPSLFDDEDITLEDVEDLCGYVHYLGF